MRIGRASYADGDRFQYLERMEPRVTIDPGTATVIVADGDGTRSYPFDSPEAFSRGAIEAHPLFPLIELVEGDSADPATVERVAAQRIPNAGSSQRTPLADPAANATSIR
jgi:hypothetical protein